MHTEVISTTEHPEKPRVPTVPEALEEPEVPTISEIPELGDINIGIQEQPDEEFQIEVDIFLLTNHTPGIKHNDGSS